jgi:hypothetical protein
MSKRTVHALGYVVLILIGLLIGLNKAIEQNHEMYLTESACVKELVESGVPRKDIILNGLGGCYVKSDLSK